MTDGWAEVGHSVERTVTRACTLAFASVLALVGVALGARKLVRR